MELQSTQEEVIAKSQTDKIDLDTIIEEIHTEHRAALQSTRTPLEHAIRAGKLLIQAKSAVKRTRPKAWERWVNNHCKSITLRTCQNYMRLARHFEKTKSVSLSSVRQALDSLSTGAIRKQKPEGNKTAKPVRLTFKAEQASLALEVWNAGYEALASRDSENVALKALHDAVSKRFPVPITVTADTEDVSDDAKTPANQTGMAATTKAA